jgi:NAD(P)-dependent dehydrogenase (short-subunit alcohol dehydrogenase family)
MNDLRGKAVLITGGTMGIGLATGLAFARQGAVCTLTHKWGTADEDEIRRLFAQEDLQPPRIIQADVSRDEDTAAVLGEMKRHHDRVEAFISNVSVALVVQGLEDYCKRALFKSIEYSAWPLFAYPSRRSSATTRATSWGCRARGRTIITRTTTSWRPRRR